jgi:hypothetical protein
VPAGSADAANSGALLSAAYHSPEEDIEIDAREKKIVRTENEYEYESEVSPNPKSVKVLTRLNATITGEQLEQVASFILASGIMQLAASYGAPEGQRHYAYEITVTFEGKPPKRVTYLSNPSFEGEPEAFKKVVAYLHELSRQLEKR